MKAAMAQDTTDAFNIAQEVHETCARRGCEASQDLVGATLRYVFQNPKFGFDATEALDCEEVQRLVTACVERLLDSHDVVVATLRMQSAFARDYAAPAEMARRHQRRVDARLAPLVREIAESQPRSQTDRDALYAKIVLSIVVRTGQGHPARAAVVRETTAVANSVFPPAAIGQFVDQSRMEKRQQLRELAAIVGGIRVFNWDAKKGGAGIEDLPRLINGALEAALAKMEETRLTTAERIGRLTILTEQLLFSEAGASASEKEKQLHVHSLVNLRQYQMYAMVIAQDVHNCGSRLVKLDRDMMGNLLELQKQLASKMAVPTAAVFPQFVRLAKTWQGFQEEMVALSELTALGDRLCALTRRAKTAGNIANGKAATTAIPRPVNTQGFACQFLAAEGDKNRADLAYTGFCPLALVNGRGLLLPGDDRLGVLRLGNNVYAFSSAERLEQFGRKPEVFLAALERLFFEYPSLERLLNVASERSGKPALTSISVQTSTHVEGGLRDPSYRWNEWDLRLDALKLCRLRKVRTRSSQTPSAEAAAIHVQPTHDEATQTAAAACKNVVVTMKSGAASSSIVELAGNLEQVL